jgi:hypothetical protein
MYRYCHCHRYCHAIANAVAIVIAIAIVITVAIAIAITIAIVPTAIAIAVAITVAIAIKIAFAIVPTTIVHHSPYMLILFSIQPFQFYLQTAGWLETWVRTPSCFAFFSLCIFMSHSNAHIPLTRSQFDSIRYIPIAQRALGPADNDGHRESFVHIRATHSHHEEIALHEAGTHRFEVWHHASGWATRKARGECTLKDSTVRKMHRYLPLISDSDSDGVLIKTKIIYHNSQIDHRAQRFTRSR